MSSVPRRELLVGGAGAAVGAALAGSAGLHVGHDRERRSGRVADAASAEAAIGQPVRLGTARLTWSVATTEDKVAFTFDDGPHPDFTPRILQILADAGVRATFNVMGWAALHHPDLLRSTVAAGHEIGNHTWTHEDFSLLDRDRTREQLARGKDAIEQVSQVPLRFLRPPRGRLTGSALQLAAELGYDVLLWSVTRGTDPGPGTVAEVTDAVAGTVRAGDVVGLHDGIGRGTFAPEAAFARALWARRDVEVRALPRILRRVAGAGLTVTTASELVDSLQPTRDA